MTEVLWLSSIAAPILSMQGYADEDKVRNTSKVISKLPKPVLDRIRRYAKEGREPRARYGHDSCMLLAFAHGQLPVVILRSPRQQFTEIRSEALVEWMRAARQKNLHRELA